MNNKINNYLISYYSKILLNTILISFCLGLILNLFEEVEFFKNSNESLLLPLILTLSYIPNLIFINLMPFIIFVSAMWFFISIKNNNELLTEQLKKYNTLVKISKQSYEDENACLEDLYSNEEIFYFCLFVVVKHVIGKMKWKQMKSEVNYYDQK